MSEQSGISNLESEIAPAEFSYASLVEEAFCAARGAFRMLSPIEWQLIESWKQRGIPLHVVLSSIEEVFKNHKARRATRRINSIRYCQDEVEAQYAEWMEMRVGAHDERSESVPGAVADGSDRNPFAKEAIVTYLRDRREQLQQLSEEGLLAHPQSSETAALAATVTGTRSRLLELIEGIKLGDLSVRSVEEDLTGLEQLLTSALHAAATPDQVMECRAKVETSMAGYARVMTEDAYRQTFSSLLNKHLRELFGVPRLSLFHMK
jgi:hypothetical protein